MIIVDINIMKYNLPIFKDTISLLTCLLTLGIGLLSIGVYLVGIHYPNGNLFIVLGSFFTYVSVVALVFKL